jgi:hypothetical protein
VIPGQGDVTGLARRRAHVNAIKLHPGVSFVVTRVCLQPDDEDGREPLLGEEPVVNERVYEAPRRVATDSQHSHDDLTESSRRDRIARPTHSRPEALDCLGKRMHPEPSVDRNEPEPDLDKDDALRNQRQERPPEVFTGFRGPTPR